MSLCVLWHSMSFSLSVCLSVWRLVCPQRLLQQCYVVGCVYKLLLLLQLRLLDHSVVMFSIFSCDSNSIGQNVSLSVRNKFYGSVMLSLLYDCCYCCCILYYLNILLLYFASLAGIAALQGTMQKYYIVARAQCRSIILLLVYDCCYCYYS